MKKSFLKKCILVMLSAALFLCGSSWENAGVQAATRQEVSGRSADAVDEESAEWIDMAGEELVGIAEERDILALVYLSDEYPIRKHPSYDSEAELTVLSGHQVSILDVYLDNDYEIWQYVKLYKGENEYYGYVPRTYLATSDARFLEWEEYYGLNCSVSTFTLNGEQSYPDIEQFPESYKPALLALKEKHPNWTFAKMNTTLDWNTVIYNELQGGRSLVYKTFPDWAKNGLYDTGTWYYATEAVLEMYMDPRNALHEDAIFQFEQLTYNEEYHTLAAVENFLNNTFMKSKNEVGEELYAPGTSMTFSYIFYMVGKEAGREVSPFHLAARVLQEQGAGTSPLISGTYPGYEGYYNYFNIGATGKTDEQVIKSGLQFAKDVRTAGHPWKDAYYSILGGADFISANYIKKGQSTLYLQKYNVNKNGVHALYTHQYMQNISAPTSEAASIKKLYASANALESPFVFSIPVYENMPGEPCGEPTPDTNVTVSLPDGYKGTELWLDGVVYEGTLKDGLLTVVAPDSKAKTAVMYQYTDAGIPTGMYVWSLAYDGMTYVATAQPGLKDLLTYHGFSVRITGDSGIRFKTGISADLRKNLLSSAGVNGFKLKEYGTLVMNNKNREQYPMIKDGEKVVSGISYGKDSSGKLKDVVFETVDGRYRYTSVLIGIPATAYKTEYAFRGYIILEKDGQTYTLYGPPVARSIYYLADLLLERGSYQPGTAPHQFLEKIISDADALTEGGNGEVGETGGEKPEGGSGEAGETGGEKPEGGSGEAGEASGGQTVSGNGESGEASGGQTVSGNGESGETSGGQTVSGNGEAGENAGAAA